MKASAWTMDGGKGEKKEKSLLLASWLRVKRKKRRVTFLTSRPAEKKTRTLKGRGRPP